MSDPTTPHIAGPADLRPLYDEAVVLGRADAYRKRRWDRAGEFIPWLDEGALPDLSSDHAVRLYRASGGRDAAAFAANPIEEVRDSLDFLLYDTIKLEGRFDECASDDGAYKLDGAGKEFVSWVLCLRSPTLFGVWNGNAERMLRLVRAYPESMKRGPMGVRYLDMLEALARVQVQGRLPDFIEVDIMSYVATRPKARITKLS